MSPEILHVSYLHVGRLAAMLILAVSISVIAIDLVRTTLEARDHTAILRAELDAIGSPEGVERLGVMQAHKARLASVGAAYAGAATTEGVFQYYGRVLAARGWGPCGRSSTAAYQGYCRGDYRARVAWPSVEGSGVYSVTLDWNRITPGVWLAGTALLLAVLMSGSILVSGLPPTRFTAWLRGRAREPLRLRTTLSVNECIERLEAASDLVFHRGRSVGDVMSFGLEKQRGRFWRTGLTPYLYGTLRADSRGQGTTILGYFGLHPGARFGGVIVSVLMVAAFGLSLSGPVRREIEWLTLAVVIGVVGLVLRGRAHRGERRQIRESLATRLDAEQFEPPTQKAKG